MTPTKRLLTSIWLELFGMVLPSQSATVEFTTNHAAIGRLVADQARAQVGSQVDDFKYDWSGPDQAVLDDGTVVPTVGVYMEMEKHVAGNSVYVLVHSDVIFALSNGRLTATVKSRIADLRIKTGAWAEWIGNILNVNLDQLISV